MSEGIINPEHVMRAGKTWYNYFDVTFDDDNNIVVLAAYNF